MDEVLLLGLHDLIMGGEVASVVRESEHGLATDEDAIRRTSLQVIRRMLEDGLAEVGDTELTEKDGVKMIVFEPWALTSEEALRKIDREWRRLPGGPRLGEDICWFRLTEKGRRRANGAESEHPRSADPGSSE